MLQLDPSNPINTILMIVIVAIVVFWIGGELKLEGSGKGAVRIICAIALSVLFMVLMFTSGMIYF